MLSLFFGAQRMNAYSQLIDAIPSGALQSPLRSTVPLLDYFRTPKQRLSELGTSVGLVLDDTSELSFERAVPVQKGRGKASYTDLMIETNDAAVAVEAKFSEPVYQSVERWLGRPAPQNRSDVLAGWVDLIRRTTKCSGIEADTFSTLPYQLVHRTASVCHASRRSRCVSYLLFGGRHAKEYTGHLMELSQILGSGSGIQFIALECGLNKLPPFIELEERWKRGERKLGDAVKSALKSGPLFRFEDLRRVTV